MAAVDTRVISIRDEALTRYELQDLLAEFAKEAFSFLIHNAQNWVEYPKDFITRHTSLGNCVVFTPSMEKAIVTISYLLRSEYRKEFQNVIHFMKDPDNYDAYVNYYPVRINDYYFYNFLTWVAFIFNFTIYCYKEGYDYFKRGEQCIARYSDLYHFNDNGGFFFLIERSVYISVIYDNLKSIMNKELPQNDVIATFLKYVENIERQNRYSNNKWLQVSPEMQYASQIRSKLSAKYDVVSRLDPLRIALGYKVILKKSTNSPQTPVSETTELDTGKTTSYSWETDDSKSVFIIHDKFLNKRKASRKDSKYKRGLKIYSPLMKREELAMNLNKILDENIKNRNYSKVGNGVFVCPTGGILKDKDTRVIVMDTSSEEEDCGVPEALDGVLQAIWLRHKERARAKSGTEPRDTAEILPEQPECISSKCVESELYKSASEMSAEQTSEQSKTTEALSEEGSKILSDQEVIVSSDGADAETKERDTAISCEE